MHQRLTILLLLLHTTLVSNNSQDPHFIFCKTSPEYKTLSEPTLYKQVVANFPICCVDIFIYDSQTKKYLEVLRRDKPAQGEYWFVGGRMYKGESFFDCAKRKVKEEAGLAVTPQKILGVYSTIFGDSAWQTQTHSINIVVLVKINSNQKISLDKHHETFRWVDSRTPPQNAYLREGYTQALTYLKE